ncbi:MAG: putative ABC transporter permease, partial [Clostridia bacterium]|nr:putative ABC transporter permease [Clostridia bacterium]
MATQLENYKSTHKLSKIYCLILYFFIFAFLGWILESLYSVYELGHFTKRGFLYGPICPIYGYGAIMLITFLNKYKNNSFK